MSLKIIEDPVGSFFVCPSGKIPEKTIKEIETVIPRAIPALCVLSYAINHKQKEKQILKISEGEIYFTFVNEWTENCYSMFGQEAADFVQSVSNRFHPDTNLWMLWDFGASSEGYMHIFVFPTRTPKEYFLEWETEQNKTQRQEKRSREAELEAELYRWLFSVGQSPERQVVTKQHRIDIWLPGKLMLELKVGKVSGDDVCQAIDYYSTYQKPIVLVGTGMSDAASRGISGFNQSLQSTEAINFVTWGAIKHYLQSVLALGGK